MAAGVTPPSKSGIFQIQIRSLSTVLSVPCKIRQTSSFLSLSSSSIIKIIGRFPPPHHRPSQALDLFLYLLSSHRRIFSALLSLCCSKTRIGSWCFICVRSVGKTSFESLQYIPPPYASSAIAKTKGTLPPLFPSADSGSDKCHLGQSSALNHSDGVPS